MWKHSFSALAALASLAACGHDLPQQATPLTVSAATAIVQTAKIEATREVAGVVRSETVSPLSARVVGNVVRVHVSAGDAVKAGQLLVEIDAREGRAQTDAAAATVAAAAANASLAETTYKRYSALRERHSVSQQELDDVEARVRSARAELQRARAGAAQARTFLDYSAVRAPMDGVVTARFVDAGAQAAPGMPLLTIEDPRAVRVEASIPEDASVRAGDRVFIDGVEARVTRVQPSVDPLSRTSLIQIGSAAPLRSGSFVRVQIPGGERTALVVPDSAIVRRGVLSSVFVVGHDGIARMRLIRLGERNEVLSGLDAGERIVVEPAKVRDGAKVS
jgi:RND family efflux transporter MFP subunit